MLEQAARLCHRIDHGQRCCATKAGCNRKLASRSALPLKHRRSRQHCRHYCREPLDPCFPAPTARPMRTYRLASAQPDTQGDGNEPQVGPGAIGEHIMEAAFNEQSGSASLEVESGACIEPEIGSSTTEDVAGIILTGNLRIVDP